jgi:hypothetical protein
VLAATAIVESIRTHAAAARRPELAREWKRIAPRYQNSDARLVLLCHFAEDGRGRSE